MKIAFLGASTLDEYYQLCDSPYPKKGEKALVSYEGVSIGGMAANAATVSSALGVQASLVCEFSDFEDSTQLIVADLKKYNIALTGLSYAPRHNLKCLVISEPTGERVIFLLNEALTKSIKLSEKQLQILLEAEYVYTNLAELRLFEERQEILSAVQKNGQGLFIDCDTNTNITHYEIEILKHATVVSFNEFCYSELLSLGYSVADLIEDFGIAFVLVTKGENGSKVYFKGGSCEQQVLDVAVKDTTGAGDAFNAGFLFALLSNLKVPDCLLFATEVASVMVSQFGTRVNVDKIRRLRKKYEVDI